ncbi:DMT family transporter [Microvirga terrestris]|uniref:EamA family transporter n=1 Tax=Microvirga terrestris TaxID=2791024 RepID=A0ABS0HTE8_9HYPH|nr:EamA family transporter [Microvirga terrestris]MBF9196766.1 EamA family transporter [Microvirga terrestris]
MGKREGSEAGHVVAFAGMALIWGLTWLPMKIASEAVPPIFLALMRFLLASLCYLAFILIKGLPLKMAQPGRVIVASVLITTGCYSLLFWGVARAPTGLSSIVNLSLMPIFVILIGALYGQERIMPRRLGAIALGVLGLVMLFSGRTGSSQDGALVGLAAVALATLSYAWGGVVSRPLMQTMHPITLAFWETSIGALGLIPVSLVVEGYDPAYFAGLTDGRAIMGLTILVLGGSLGGFSIYLWLVRDWGAFRAGLYSFVSPVVAVAVGVAFANEAFGWPEAIGMAVMLSATALALTEGKRAAISA